MNNGGLAALAEQYGLALGDFLARFDEGARLHAYELGRRALIEDAGILDLVTIHHHALEAFLSVAEGSMAKIWLARAAEFLGECLAPFEMSQRGYREANSELRRMNLTLQEKIEEAARANRELEAFSYSVAHDLRAPLRSIDGFSGILMRDHANQLDAGGQEYLRLVHTSAKRMGQLIDDLLNLSRFARAELHCRPLDLAALVGEVVQRLRREQPERQVDFRVEGDLPAAYGDPGLVDAVLQNLLDNAWKYTRRCPLARIEFGWSGEKRAYFVRDNGAGFDMAYAGKLFQVFHRLHSLAQFEGTGVGLAIVRRIVERHGGRIWAEAQPDRGASFYFTLAAEHGAPASATRPFPLPPAPGAMPRQ